MKVYNNNIKITKLSLSGTKIHSDFSFLNSTKMKIYYKVIETTHRSTHYSHNKTSKSYGYIIYLFDDVVEYDHNLDSSDLLRKSFLLDAQENVW